MSWFKKKLVNPLSRAVRKVKLRDIIAIIQNPVLDDLPDLLNLKAQVEDAIRKLQGAKDVDT